MKITQYNNQSESFMNTTSAEYNLALTNFLTKLIEQEEEYIKTNESNYTNSRSYKYTLVKGKTFDTIKKTVNFEEWPKPHTYVFARINRKSGMIVGVHYKPFKTNNGNIFNTNPLAGTNIYGVIPILNK